MSAYVLAFKCSARSVFNRKTDDPEVVLGVHTAMPLKSREGLLGLSHATTCTCVHYMIETASQGRSRNPQNVV